MLRRSRRGQRGQVLIFAALVFMTVMLALIGAVADLLVSIDASARAHSAAYVGAVSGGQDVDLSGTSGSLGKAVPLRFDAAQVCQQQAKLTDPDGQASCGAAAGVVTATVCETVRYPLSVLGISGRVCDIERAGPAAGTVSAR